MIGEYRGLMFGLLSYPHFKPEVFLEGAMARTTSLTMNDPGPRAVLNALERLAASYPQEIEKTGERLAVAEGQLRDYEARRGQPFSHDAVLSELERSRDALKDALSGRRLESEEQPQSSVSELAQRIKQLQSARVSDGEVRRSDHERVSIAEEPITARVRRRIETVVEEHPEKADID
jgi:hypothetical protein